MRILLITRVQPLGEPFGTSANIHDRIRELTELGHEIMVFTRWDGEARDYGFSNRAIVRSPFRSFRLWEWPKALPMVIGWRPDVLHVIDPGLSGFELATSVEVAALGFADLLKIPGRIVSISQSRVEHGDPRPEKYWRTAGAQLIESEWLRSPGIPSEAKSRNSTQILLAGDLRERPNLVRDLLEGLRSLRLRPEVEIVAICNRRQLPKSERAALQRAEREPDGSTHQSAVGRRLHLLREFDERPLAGAILAGLSPLPALKWGQRVHAPLLLSEDQAELATEFGPRVVKPLAPAAAWMTTLILRATTDASLQAAWEAIAEGTVHQGRDSTANKMSRLYTQMLSGQL